MINVEMKRKDSRLVRNFRLLYAKTLIRNILIKLKRSFSFLRINMLNPLILVKKLQV
jgi:hypothetical protein